MSETSTASPIVPPQGAPGPGSVFSGFRRVLHRGALVFALIIAILFALIAHQHQRSATAIRSVEQARQTIGHIDALRIYLLNLDSAVRKYADSGDPVHLDHNLICRRAPCPSAEGLIAMVEDHGDLAARLAPLPVLQLALETGFSNLQQRAAESESVPAPATAADLSGFDKSAMDKIHRLLIAAGQDALRQLEIQEKAQIRDQSLASALLGVAGLWTGLVLFGLYRETTRLIHAGIAAEKTIRQLSLRDPLTGLANRRFLQENEKRLLAGARRAGKQLAVLTVDLDDFKAVNDVHGHAAGDTVLVTAAERMSGLLRDADVIARFGGDEFVIVLGQVDDAAAAREVANRLVEQVSQPVPLADGNSVRVGASVGIAMCCTATETLHDLLRKADEALYAAKRDGKNTYRVAAAASRPATAAFSGT